MNREPMSFGNEELAMKQPSLKTLTNIVHSDIPERYMDSSVNASRPISTAPPSRLEEYDDQLLISNDDSR
jgi:hypothetical protein